MVSAHEVMVDVAGRMTQSTAFGSDATSLRATWGLLPPVLVGVVLRLFRVDEQILVWDELHTVKAALARPIGEILRNWMYQAADYCVPMTAFARALLDGGVRLSEMHFRVVPLAAGVAALVVIPVGLRPKIGDRAATTLAWLLAISPLLVLYSRIVRSYMPATLFAFVALMSFDLWWRTRSRPASVAYVGFAVLAIYFHLGSAPVVLSPFVFAAIETVLRARDRSTLVRNARSLAIVFGAVSLVLGAVLLPAAASLASLTRSHRGAGVPSLDTVVEVVRLEAGTTSIVLAAFMALLALRGAIALARRDPRFRSLLAVAAIAHVVGLGVLRPVKLEEALPLTRYLLVLLPFALALVALGATESWGRTSRPHPLQWVAVALLLLLVFSTGPLSSREFVRGNLVHHPGFMRFTVARETRSRTRLPRAYEMMIARLGGGPATLVEDPWANVGSRVFFAYQSHHELPFLPVAMDPKLRDPRLSLRNDLEPAVEAILETSASHLVLHRDLQSELRAVRRAEPEGERRSAVLEEYGRYLRQLATDRSRELRAAWGAPEISEDGIEIWDLEAARARGGSFAGQR